MSLQHPFAPFMREAVILAQRGRWTTAPNPCVGALLVREGLIVARGWHTACGEAHAEVECLRDAAKKGIDPAACTLVVTLEPCNHTGKTPPCSHAIIAAGIRHVVVGTCDPNPVAQGGIAFLREHGVRVETGICEQDCRDSIADFITWQSSALPYGILKLASTLDGRIATRTGHSRWVTGNEARQRVHTLRSHVDAVIVGGNTFRVDNPRLTCRLQDAPRQPLAVVVTSRLPSAKAPLHLLHERPHETIFWTSQSAACSAPAEALRRCGIQVTGLTCTQSGKLDLHAGLALLRAEHQCHYTLCEGGGALALSMLEAGLAHELELHMSPKLLGDDKAVPLFAGRAPERMDQALDLRVAHVTRIGQDIILGLRLKEN